MALASTQARAQDELPAGPQRLILELQLNGVKSPLLWQFDLFPDGSLATSAERLRLIGIDLATLGIAADAPVVRLADLPGVRYRYIESTQSIEIETVDSVLTPVVLDEARAPTPFDPARVEQNFGAVLSYGLYGYYGSGVASLSGQYEARLLTPWGVLSSTGYGRVSNEGPRRAEHVRLDTYWRHVDTRHVLAFTVGDLVAEGGDLGAVYRLGGIQVRRDFGNRADLVTTALPIFSGTAALPSTVDLYVNGVRYFTGETTPGRSSSARCRTWVAGVTTTVVLTDALGRETRIEKPVFFSPRLLPRGMIDFSLEAGFPRLKYGSASFDYLDEPAASGSIRYGWRDWLTVMAHAEGMKDFANVSAGAALRVGGYGVVTARGAVSDFRGVIDTRYAIDVEGGVAGINFFGSIERAHAGYQDVVRVVELKAASVRSDLTPEPLFDPAAVPILLPYSSASERAGLSFSVFDTGVGLTYARLRLPRLEGRLAGISLNRTLFDTVSVWVNAYRDFGDRADYGVHAGVTVRSATA
jgi:outer membrane usher protein